MKVDINTFLISKFSCTQELVILVTDINSCCCYINKLFLCRIQMCIALDVFEFERNERKNLISKDE